MEFKPSNGFMEDIVKLACLCDENGTDSMEIAFNIGDGAKAIVELTFRAEGCDGKDGNNGKGNL